MTRAPAPDEATLARRRAWERATNAPLVVLGILFVVGYSVWVLAQGLGDRVLDAILAVLLIAWVVFLVDAVVRISLTPRGARGAYIVAHPFELLSALLPVFRALRVVRLVLDLPALERRTGSAVRARIIVAAVGYAVVFVYFIALATLQAERGAPDATIEDFGDAIWWACVTLATVGYGDMVPVTTVGRINAVLLMAGGIAIVGTASAVVLSMITERIGAIRGREPR